MPSRSHSGNGKHLTRDQQNLVDTFEEVRLFAMDFLDGVDCESPNIIEVFRFQLDRWIKGRVGRGSFKGGWLFNYECAREEDVLYISMHRDMHGLRLRVKVPLWEPRIASLEGLPLGASPSQSNKP